MSFTIIGGFDNREVAHGYENTGIVAVNNTTGFIVGDHHIATAAHCVMEDNDFEPVIEIFTYDRSGERDGGELTVAEVHVPQIFVESAIYSDVHDYALITVTEDLSDRVQFSIGNSYSMTNSEVGTIPIHVTGMPSNIGQGLIVTNYPNALYTHYGSVYQNDNRSMLHYTVDTSGGQSGSPVYTITRERYNNTDYYTYTALAIHTLGPSPEYNLGPLMTKYHLQFYRNNPYANYQ